MSKKRISKMQKELYYNYLVVLFMTMILLLIINHLKFSDETKTIFNFIFVIWGILASIILWLVIKFKNG